MDLAENWPRFFVAESPSSLSFGLGLLKSGSRSKFGEGGPLNWMNWGQDLLKGFWGRVHSWSMAWQFISHGPRKVIGLTVLGSLALGFASNFECYSNRVTTPGQMLKNLVSVLS